MIKISTFLSAILAWSVLSVSRVALAANDFNNLDRSPDSVTITTETDTISLAQGPGDSWTNDPVRVTTCPRPTGLEIVLSAPGIAVKSLEIRWHADMPVNALYLGDAWERAYGDLEWRPLNPSRIMPWYFLAHHKGVTDGFGVKTGPSAMCYWTVETNGITLHADVRCGGMGVELGKRKLPVCTVVCREGETNETPFAADRAICRQMCPRPRMPRQPVYGFNDWYCTYGHDTAEKFLANVQFVAELSRGNRNRPFAVVDDGWQWKGEHGESPGLWNQVNPAFSSTMTMPEFAGAQRRLGVRPGLWFRPLIANADQPQSWRLQRDPKYLDPTVPQVRALIRRTVRRFRGWGYELIKHDFSTFDICGRWGMDMHGNVTADGWAFADRSKTTAEVIRGLYEDIRSAAGNHTVIDGCNTIGHLSAGLFEMQRVGDDTSGNNWARTRKMGVNCLAFRAPQQGAFFAIDPDCVGQTTRTSMPWEKNSQWLYLVAHSGTTLFLSIPCDTLDPAQKQELREALSAASRPQPLAEPLDWQNRRIPEQWLLDGQKKSFSWNLLSDRTRNFIYDTENELIGVWATNSWSNSFAYDGMLRRRIERDYTWQSGSWQETAETHFIYDGNVVVEERNAGNVPLVSYTRGIGGLLARTTSSQELPGTPSTTFYHADGNGNITALMYPSGQLAAKYLYDPFGNMHAMSGPLANLNKYRFSSKEWNDAAGLYYFGYRFYDPILQRWINRDPIGEDGGLNLYGYCGNGPLGLIDVLGLAYDPNAWAVHHFFPQSLQYWFADLEINVHAADNTIQLQNWAHGELHEGGDYVQAWKDWFGDKPENRTASQAWAQLAKLNSDPRTAALLATGRPATENYEPRFSKIQQYMNSRGGLSSEGLGGGNLGIIAVGISAILLLENAQSVAQ